jgi:precorrin-6Y C5,15-methyltransferase (decarboxylating)
MSREPLRVVGIGDDGPAGLTPVAALHVAAAAILVGGRRHLDFFPGHPAGRILIDADRERWLREVRAVYPQRKTVVLASGDPLFHGVGRLLLEAVPREDLVFLPHVSSVQLAFARIKEPWHDARIVSLHGRPLECLLPVLHERPARIALLTDPANDPAAIARVLLANAMDREYHACVCENLDGRDERVWRGSVAAMAETTFAPLNLVVLLREAAFTPPLDPRPLLGLADDSLQRRGDMITRRDVRLLTLGYLELRASDVFWDIGAGSGSVSIEAARLSAGLRVFAIERDRASCLHIEENLKNLGLTRVAVVRGAAPEALAPLPDPDAVFLGGSGGQLGAILEAVAPRLRRGGRLVLNCIALETLTLAWDWLRSHGWQPEATSVQLAHTRPLGSLTCFEPEKPITILRARKA